MRPLVLALALSGALLAPGALARAQEAAPDAPATCPGAIDLGGLAGQRDRIVGWSCSDGVVVAFLRASHSPFADPVAHQELGPIAWTDDHGHTWHQPSWSDAELPRAMAIDPETGWGLLVGENGAVWRTIDGGRTFESEGDAGPTPLVAVKVLGRVGVAIDAHGGAFIIGAAGARHRIEETHARSLELGDGVIIVHAAEGTRLVHRDGTVAR